MSDFLKFERDGLDFPFYNDGLSKNQWMVLCFGLLLTVLLVLCSNILKPIISETVFRILICIIPASAFLYVSKGDFSLIIKKPAKKDFILIIGMVILSYIYTAIVSVILTTVFGIQISAHTALPVNNIIFYFITLIQLFGEELIKFLLFIILFTLLFRYTKDRKVVMIVSTLLTLACFGLMHYSVYSGKILQILLIQGLGSIFTMFAYLKTKNIFVSYMIHFIIDFISVISPV